MKTFEEALLVLRVNCEPDGQPDRLSVANVSDIAKDVIAFGGIDFIVEIAKIMLSNEKITVDQVVSFGLTLFASGIRVGQEMEKP
jgi:hypothetical protein